jgi:hypothetical protein
MPTWGLSTPAWSCWHHRYAGLLLAHTGAGVLAEDTLGGGDLGTGCLASREYRSRSLASLATSGHGGAGRSRPGLLEQRPGLVLKRWRPAG